jgi:hypothetical protein
MKYRGFSGVTCLVVLLVTMAVLTTLPQGSMAGTDGGRTAADFLQIGWGARAAAMSDAFTAVSRGAEATYWNPAGLAFMESPAQVSFGHLSWYQDASVEHGAAAFRVGDRWAVGAALTFLGYGDIEGYDREGTATGSRVEAFDWAGGLSGAVAVTDALALGITARFVNQRLDDISAEAAGFDLGARLNLGSVTLAAVAANLGPRLEFEGVSASQPTMLRLGAAVRPFGRGILTGLEIRRDLTGSNTILRHGVELSFDDTYFLRGGYSVYPGDEARSLIQQTALGAGLRWGSAEIDYAFGTAGQFADESLHRLSIRLSVGR